MNRSASILCATALAGLAALPCFAGDDATADRDPSMNFKIDVESFIPPTITHQRAPYYSAYVRAEGIQGQVVLKGRVDAEGSLLDLTVAEGPSRLRRAAKKAVSQWEFEPAQSEGRAIAVNIEVKVNFVLAGTETDETASVPESTQANVTFSRPQPTAGS